VISVVLEAANSSLVMSANTVNPKTALDFPEAFHYSMNLKFSVNTANLYLSSDPLVFLFI